MADFARANWLAELLPNRLEVTNHGCPIHGFLVENSTNTETPVSWMADTYYSVGEYHDNGTHHYIVSAVELDQLSGATEPSWPTDGTDVVDNHVTWTDLGPIGTAEGVYDAPGGTIEHDAFPSGLHDTFQSHNSCQLLQVPGLPEITRSTAEQASDAVNKYRWRNYALLVNNWLHGRKLLWTGRNAEFPTYDYYNDQRHGFIYVDGNSVPWCIEVQSWPIVTSDSWHVEVWLRRLFGRFSRNKSDLSDNGPGTLDGLFILLASYTTPAGAITAPSGETYMQDNDTGFTLTRNSTGSVVFAHLYSSAADTGVFKDDTGIDYDLRAVIKIEMSGDGLVVDETGPNGPLGTGISASVSLYKDKDDVYTYSHTLTGTRTAFSNTGTYVGETGIGGRVFNTPVAPDCANVSPYSGYTDYVSAQLQSDGYPSGSTVDLYVDVETTLWRCTFDADDNPIDIAYRISRQEYGDFEVTITGADRSLEYDWQGTWNNVSGTCVQTGDYVHTDSGPITNGLSVNWGDEVSYQLLRDGIVADELVIKENNNRSHSVTGPANRDSGAGGSVGNHIEPLSDGTFTQSLIISGTVDAREYTIKPHIYSLDVVGLIFYRTEVGPGAAEESVLSAVATPGGTDDTHKGVSIPTASPNLSGAYDPKNKTVVWNVEGLTDLGDGNTFTFV
jgi:hypothetical protein